MQSMDIITIAIGLTLGMFYYHKTGWACGGIIVPGILAIHINNPNLILFSMAEGIVVYIILKAAVHCFGLYGRQRIATAMLIALILRLFLTDLPYEGSLWLGWVVPGLIGADIQRQGWIPTFSSTISITIVSAMIVEILSITAGYF